MRDPVSQRVGLAGSGAGDNQQRSRPLSVCQSNAVFHSLPLLLVQFFQIGNRHAVIPDKCLSVLAVLVWMPVACASHSAIRALPTAESALTHLEDKNK